MVNNSVKRRAKGKGVKSGVSIRFEFDRMLDGELVFSGPPELMQALLEEYGGIEGLRQLMRDACPICSAGGQHEHDIL
jgi:hypothetical protein